MIRCILLYCAEFNKTQVCVLEHVGRQDMPAALGYFLLNFFEEIRQGNYLPDVTITTALVPQDKLKILGDVRFNALEADEYGDVFELMTKIVKNERDEPKPKPRTFE